MMPTDAERLSEIDKKYRRDIAANFRNGNPSLSVSVDASDVNWLIARVRELEAEVAEAARVERERIVAWLRDLVGNDDTWTNRWDGLGTIEVVETILYQVDKNDLT